MRCKGKVASGKRCTRGATVRGFCRSHAPGFRRKARRLAPVERGSRTDQLVQVLIRDVIRERLPAIVREEIRNALR